MRDIVTRVRTFGEWEEYDKENGTNIAEKILDRHRDFEVRDREWWDTTIYDMKEYLKAVGVSDPDINFSGFSSQGDGASFTGVLYFEDMLAAAERYDEIVAERWVPRETPERGSEEPGALIPLPTPPKHHRLLIACGVDLDMRFVRGSSRYYHHLTVETEEDWSRSFDCDVVHEADGPHVTRYHQSKSAAECEAWEERVEEWRRDVCHAIYDSLEREYEWLQSDEVVKEALVANEHEFDEEGNIA